jgi:hypothetical protein
MESKLTFEEFQQTRRWSDSIADAMGWDIGTPKGNVYLDGLYIEHVEPHWPEDAKREGEWYLILGRDEWISNDLTALERRLYEWAGSEGYFE